MYYSPSRGFTSTKESDEQVYVYDKDYQDIMAAVYNGAVVIVNDQGYPSFKFNPLYYSIATGFTVNRANDMQIEIDHAYWEELIIGQSKGKIIANDENGYPYLADPPPPTHEDYVAEATRNKTYLMAQATVAINPLQDAVDLEEATDEEVALLKKWKQFRVAVNRVDPNLAPDITWPVPPVAIPEMGTMRQTQTEAPTS